MRIATFTFRSVPQRPGCAGVDKVTVELHTRLAARGHQVVTYNRLFRGEAPLGTEYRGVQTRNFYTLTRKKGFDSILHSFEVVWDIIRHDTAITFWRGEVDDPDAQLAWALHRPAETKANGLRGRERARREFSRGRCADRSPRRAASRSGSASSGAGRARASHTCPTA